MYPKKIAPIYRGWRHGYTVSKNKYAGYNDFYVLPVAESKPNIIWGLVKAFFKHAFGGI